MCVHVFSSFVTSLGPEYGTTASAWKGVLTEADRMADVHLQICDSLRENVEKEIALWKKENFRKSAIGLCKEAKTLEEDFKKASQPFDLDLSSHSHVIAVTVFRHRNRGRRSITSC